MLSKRLKEILGDKDLSIGSFAEMCDLPVETVRNIYYGRTADPKVSTVMQMSKALDMSVNCLMGEYSSCPEGELLGYYRSCGNHGKSLILLTAKYDIKDTAKSAYLYRILRFVRPLGRPAGLSYSF